MANAKMLTNLNIREVSGVDVPANQGAKVLLTKFAGKDNKQEDTPMDKAQLEKTITEALAKGLAPVTEAAELAKALALMSEVEKNFYQTLKSDADKAKFVKGGTLEQRMKDFPAMDPEEEAEGEDNADKTKGKKKSATEKALEKRAAQDAEELCKRDARIETLEKAEKQRELEKRATTELANVPGDMVAKCNLLKSLEGMEKADADKVLAMVKGAGDLAAKFTKSLGNGGESVTDGPQAELNKMADEIVAKSNGKTSFAKAYTQALKSPKGSELYGQLESGQA